MENDIRELIKNLKVSYHSGHGDKLHQDFYSPLLANCNQYKRETGDFTSNVILDWGEALLNVIDKPEGECVIKIIAAPNLREEDKLLLTEVMNKQKDESYIDQITDNIFHEAFDFSKGNPENEIKLKIFAYLIVKKILILKFGFPKHVPSPGVFHSKAGIFYFDDELKVGFSGGANETHGGYVGNIERIDVFRNLDHEDLHINDIENKFELGWEGRAPGFITKKLNKKILDEISSYAPVSKKELKKEITKFNKENNKTLGESISEENRKKLESLIKPKITNTRMDEILEEKEDYLVVTEPKWEFQKKAREKFIAAKWGILEMATGTGKTRTALSIITQLINEDKVDKIIIQMKGKDLIKQWRSNASEWSMSKIDRTVNILECSDVHDDLDLFIMNFKNPEIDLLLIRQSSLPRLLDQMKDMDQSRTIIIHDEVHDLFAEKISEKVLGKQDKFAYKLGLSATIKEPYNEEREKLLFKEIQGGGSEAIYTYELTQAIKDGILVESQLIELTYKLYQDEKDEITKAINTCYAQKKAGIPKNEADAQRNMAIADVRKNARNKIEVFNKEIEWLKDKLMRSFIFTDEIVYGKKILNIITPHLNVKTHFSGGDKENLNNFSKKEIDCIVNVERLSQGIDIQNLNTIVLFSTPQGRQFKQRIGRVLRKDKQNPNKKAVIIDFFDEDYMISKKEDSSDYKRYIELKEITETTYDNR